MKRKIAAGFVLACTMALVGCSSSGGGAYLYPEYPEYTASDYVTLGDYQNLSVTIEPETEVTEAMLDEQVNMYIAKRMGMTQTKTGTAKDGDYVQVSYTAVLDGEEVAELSAEEDHFQLGSNSMVEGLEEAVVGMNVGDTKEFTITFPENWTPVEYQNQTVDYTLTLEALESYPEVTDNIVNLASNGNYATIEELKQHLREDGESYYQSDYKERLQAAVQGELKEICEVKEIPEELETWYVQIQLASLEDAAEASGVSMEEYLEQNDTSLEEATEQAKEDAQESLPVELIAHAIGEAEEIEVPDSVYETQIAAYAAGYGYEDTDAFLRAYGKSSVWDSIYVQYVLDWVADQATVTEGEPDASSGVNLETDAATEAETAGE